MLFSFLLLKNNKKADKFCMKFSPNPNVSMQRCHIPYFFYTPYTPPPFFVKLSSRFYHDPLEDHDLES